MKQALIETFQGKNNSDEKPSRFPLKIPNKTSKSFFGIFVLLFCLLGFAPFVCGQTDQSNVRFTQGDINENATVELGVPLGQYPGRGLDLPVSLNYSSTVWRIEHLAAVQNYNVYSNYSIKQSITQALFAEHSTAGWKSTLDLPIIEFPKTTEFYDYKGQETTSSACSGYRIARVYIYLPDGSTN